MGIIQGSLGNGDHAGVRVDKMTHALMTVTYAHHEIHDGSHYEAVVSDQLSAAGSHVDIAIGVPGWMPWQNDTFDTLYHLIYGVWSSQPYSIGVYEGVTSFTGGTVQTPMNNNRMVGQAGYPVDKTSDLDITAGSLTRTGGTLIHPLEYHGSKAEVSAKTRESEIILRAGSIYIITLTMLATAASNCGIHAAWYESRPKY